MKAYFLAIFLLPSCTIAKWANPPRQEEMHAEAAGNKPFWLGRNSDDLILHPVFATKQMDRRKASNGQEVITFKNSLGRKGTSGVGMSSFSVTEIECNHVFYLQNDKITDYQRIGNCTEEEDPALRPATPAIDANSGQQNDVIRTVLLENLPKFRSCYVDEATKTNISYKGVVHLRFMINSQGAVEGPQVNAENEIPESIKNCVVNTMTQLQFPKPLNGGSVEVKQPMNFYPKDV